MPATKTSAGPRPGFQADNPNFPDAPHYVRAPLRLEWRKRDLYVRAELERALELYKELRIGAWWIGVVGPKGALFRSQVVPVHPDLEDDVLPWLSKQCDQAGIALITHFPVEPTTMDNYPLIAQHPEWRMQFLRDEEGREAPPDAGPNACPNSPYMETLEAFVQELVGPLGLKGLWHDSAPLSASIGGQVWVGCCCPRCAERFRRETGFTMPERIEWGSPDFRAFVDWRYGECASMFRRVALAVRQANPSAVTVIHTARKWSLDWRHGGCFQPLDFPVLFGCEDDGAAQFALLTTKYQRAMSTYPPEMYQALSSFPVWRPVLPNPEPEGRILYSALAAMTHGGWSSYGTAVHPALLKDTLTPLGCWLRPRAPWVGGEPVRYAALAVSRHTLDFSPRGREKRDWGSTRAWESCHGMDELLTQVHVPTEVLFDEQLAPEHLGKYAVVVLPEVTCLGDEAAAALDQYVRGGGHLIATGSTGTLGLRGEPRARGCLDDLLGLAERAATPAQPSFVPCPELARDLPGLYAVFAGLGSADGFWKVRAAGLGTVQARFAWLPEFPLQEQDWTDRDQSQDTDAIIVRRHGRGRTVYLAWDIGGGFYGAAKRRTRLLMRNLLSDAPAQPYHIEGPPWLVATAWRQAGNRLVFHLLQGQGTPARFPQWWGHITLEDVPPVDNIRIVLPDRDVSRCWMPLPNAELPLATAGDGVAVTVPRVVRHEIVVFEVEPHENAFSQPHRRGSC